jgi:hypothetical protein
MLCSHISADGDVLLIGFIRAHTGDFAELCLVVLDTFCEDIGEILGVPRGDGDDGFGPRLVGPGDLVEEDEGKLVVLEGHLDSVGENGIERLGNINGNFSFLHTILFNVRYDKAFLRRSSR